MMRLRFLPLLAMIFLLTFTGNEANGQMDKKWEAGLFLGTSNYQGDLTKNSVFTLNETNFAYGFQIKRHLSPNWAVQLGYRGGRLTGDDKNFSDDATRAKREFRFESPINDIAVRAEWDFLGHLRFRDSVGNYTFRRMLTPYLFAGVGVSFFNPETVYGNGIYAEEYFEEFVNEDKSNMGSQTALVTPIGLGIKYDINETWNIGLEAGYRPPFSDFLDGVSKSGDPDDNDWYVFGGLTLGAKLNSGKDTDGDGVSDSKDKCPEIPGSADLMGCPDSDMDGIADAEDDCPMIAGIAAFNGCPDTDGDGVKDSDDNCPDVAGLASMYGCPDTDGDGITDADDKCPTVAGVKSLAGCPDTDGDGITDADDKCPNEAGPAANKGCPDTDGDGDGVVDRLDSCPQVAGLSQFKGCPDTDNDGVEDSKDKCPNTAGPPSNQGCPEVVEEDQKILDFAVQNIQFETSSATFKKVSYKTLDEIVRILKEYPYYSVKISGHTDNVGEDAANMTLSEKRAQACFNYLKSKGIEESRMTAKGFGETTPVATNDTPEGRKANRRVEFELYIK